MKTKKRIGVALSVIMMALTAGWNVYQSRNEVDLSDLTLENMEALASGETSHCMICQGFEMRYQGNCSICVLVGGNVVCHVQEQVPC
ncbi:MAG: hypothetical protein E7085_04810 [Parabacteroides distasonis]|nr:hypothetical protein [Parabacteroides distasonis]